VTEWRLSASLQTLLDEVNAAYPDRDKRTDGQISGYPGAVSSHNVNSAGVVNALDITTGDYPGGISKADGMAEADRIRLNMSDGSRGYYAYVIHHMEPPYVPYSGPWIADADIGGGWGWGAYTGADPHTSHIHVSSDWDIPSGGAPSGVCPYDSIASWGIGTSTQAATIKPIPEDDLTPEQAAQLKTVFDKISRYLDAPTGAIPAKVWAETVLRGGQQISVKQELADAKTYAGQNLSKTVAAPSIDVKALAAEVAANLTTNQAHQFIVALGQALPKE
jgi:hypothetical protein